MTRQAPTTPEQLEAIIAKAAEAAPKWAATSNAERGRVLVAIADALDNAGPQLIATAQKETNLAEGRLQGELKRTTFQLRLFAEVLEEGSYLDARIDHADADWPMGAPRPDLRRVLEPLGPVTVFAASNFPFAFSVAGGDTASSLAAGCSVILKAHSGHILLSRQTGEVVKQALAEAGAPEGLFDVIYGTESGSAAIQDPRVKAGAFTGSIPGGRALFDLANARPEPIPFYGELGSVNPTIITRGAAAERAQEIVDGFIGSFTMGAGQFCTKPGLFVVPEESNIVELLKAAENPPAAKLLNDRIQSGYEEELSKLLGHDAIEVILSSEGQLADPPTPTLVKVSAADFLANTEDLFVECFGPAAMVVTYTDEQQLIDIAKVIDGQLTATIFGNEDEQIVSDLLPLLAVKAGRLLWGQWPTGVSVTYAQQHGGPYPATTAVTTTSVGTAAISRFLRPVAYQNIPQALLPLALRDDNPLGIPQRINGKLVVGN